jgi:hypothetical protein
VVEVAEHGATDVNEAAWPAALALRDLLKYEFFFPRKREFAERRFVRPHADAAPFFVGAEARRTAVRLSPLHVLRNIPRRNG